MYKIQTQNNNDAKSKKWNQHILISRLLKQAPKF